MNERLEQRIERFLRTDEGDFDALALELFSYQFERNRPYQAFCKAQGCTPGTVTRWQDVPAVPIRAFKSTELATFPISQAAAVFHSSGTTRNQPSRHFFRTLTYYETALASGFARWVLADQARLPYCVLAPTPGEIPHSSLSWMLEVVLRKWGASGSDYYVRRGEVEEGRLFHFIEQRQAQGEPVALLGTTLAFLQLFERCARQGVSFRCATGSRLMDTGGMKTQDREVSRSEFLRDVWAYLGIPEAGCINEYGMCELSSQFYARGASEVFQGPTWVRTLGIDPGTGQPVGEGQTGLLRHFDLANVDSVMAIQTEDRGTPHPAGFVFKGRANGADLKGCSLALESYLKPA